MSLEEAVKTLDMRCSWGYKKNSQGNLTYWKGYKVHLDVTECEIPISVVVTGAGVHDSQVPIPLEKMTETRVTHLYSLMDAAYDSEVIDSFIRQRGRVASIDHNKRRNATRPGFDPATQQRYSIRTTVEPANSHLKDWLLSSPYFARGIENVTFQVMCGVVYLHSYNSGKISAAEQVFHEFYGRKLALALFPLKFDLFGNYKSQTFA